MSAKRVFGESLSASDAVAFAPNTNRDYFKLLVVPCNAFRAGLEKTIIWRYSALHHGQRLIPPRGNKPSANTCSIADPFLGVVLRTRLDAI